MAKQSLPFSNSSAKVCLVHLCDRTDIVGREWCSKHYQRWRHYKDPLGGTKSQPREWLDRLLDGPLPSTCVIWPFYTTNLGYGQATLHGRPIPAHRLSLALYSGKLPPDKLALHQPLVCHNRKCVNPLHLYWGTPADNVRDTAIDGTMPVGSKQYGSKFTEEQIRTVRRRVITEGERQCDVAQDMNMSQSYVNSIVHGRKWGRLK